jgi:DNA-binding MarR family transcriptional regulator
MGRNMTTEVAVAGVGGDASISVEEQAYIALLRTADRLLREFADWLEPYDLSPTQYNALRILRGAGSAGLPCREVGARMMSRDPDVTRLVDRLEKRGLVVRRREKSDRRVVRAAITPAGMDVLKRLDKPVGEFVRKLMGQLKTERLLLLTQLLEEARSSGPH